MLLTCLGSWNWNKYYRGGNKKQKMQTFFMRGEYISLECEMGGCENSICINVTLTHGTAR